MPKMVPMKRLREVPQPEYKTHGAAGFDLSAAEQTSFEPQGFKLVPTGLALATPSHHFLMLTPRSSLFKRRGLILTNSPGIIDSDYCGDDDEILLALFNPTAQPCTLDAGERIAQGVFVRYTAALWQEVETLDMPSRGGFGSTGY